MLYINFAMFFFFFQAEDGIRDFHVTGVQTCALPISSGSCATARSARSRSTPGRSPTADGPRSTSWPAGNRPGPREPDGYPDRVGCRFQRDRGRPARSGVVGVVRPGVWQPPVACSRLEREVIKRVKRARLFVWLREHRHELFDEDIQAELAGMYQDARVGQPPVPPAQLGLATI